MQIPNGSISNRLYWVAQSEAAKAVPKRLILKAKFDPSLKKLCQWLWNVQRLLWKKKTRERGLIKVPNVRNIHMLIFTPYLGLLMAKDKADSDSLLAAAS